MESTELVRLQKYIADCGIASRRHAEELILHNLIMVNNTIVNQLGFKINPDKDVVTYEGKVIKPEKVKVYIMLNKPVGFVTTSKDQFNRNTVLDLVKTDYRLYPVGRLDYDTSGLLILTNDGDTANKLMHPKFKVDKTYLAEVIGIPKKADLENFRHGLQIEDYITSPAQIEVLSVKGNSCKLKITIHEGRNRQVRKMCQAIGLKVTMLKRTNYGRLDLGRLHEGCWRNLTREEIQYLKGMG